MDTKCSSCTAPITVFTDKPEAPHQCEACETYIELQPEITVVSFEGLISEIKSALGLK
jgi:hypothetical protein